MKVILMNLKTLFLKAPVLQMLLRKHPIIENTHFFTHTPTSPTHIRAHLSTHTCGGCGIHQTQGLTWALLALGLSLCMDRPIYHVIWCGEWTGHYQQSAIDPRLGPQLLFICRPQLAPSINERN